MYAGHAAVALALRTREPRVRLVPLAFACYGPDWVEAAVMLVRPHDAAAYSHSLGMVLVGATLAAGAYALLLGKAGALAVFAGWVLHLPADLVTGRKPVFRADDLIGMNLYAHRLTDFVLESCLVVLACVLFARHQPRTPRARWTIAALAAVLIAGQAVIATY